MNNKFYDFLKEKQKEIDELSNQIKNITFSVEKEAQKLYNEGGVDNFKISYPVEYYGVCSVNIPDIGWDSKTWYLFPYGVSEDHEGWVSSSEMC